MFTGILAEREKNDALAACDIFALPSEMENFGISIVEAMFFGKSIVASSVGGVPYVIQDGRTGILLNSLTPEAFAEEVVRLLSDSSLGIRLGQNARNDALRGFTLEAMINAHEHSYSQLVSPSHNSVS